MELEVKKLIITQYGLRYPNQIKQMTEFTKGGGIFTQEAINKHFLDATKNDTAIDELIQISQFEDGKLYIHNGHHRCLAIYLSGRKNLDATEYRVTTWTYDQYQEIVFEKNNTLVAWVTPFDPRTHIRIANILEFKNKMIKMYRDKGEIETKAYIRTHPEQYLVKRNCTYLNEFAQCTSI